MEPEWKNTIASPQKKIKITGSVRLFRLCFPREHHCHETVSVPCNVFGLCDHVARGFCENRQINGGRLAEDGGTRQLDAYLMPDGDSSRRTRRPWTTERVRRHKRRRRTLRTSGGLGRRRCGDGRAEVAAAFRVGRRALIGTRGGYRRVYRTAAAVLSGRARYFRTSAGRATIRGHASHAGDRFVPHHGGTATRDSDIIIIAVADDDVRVARRTLVRRRCRTSVCVNF